MISCPEPKLIRSQNTCGGREIVGGGGVERKDRGEGGTTGDREQKWWRGGR